MFTKTPVLGHRARPKKFQELQPVAATLTKNVFLWLVTFGQKIEIDPVAQLKIVKHH